MRNILAIARLTLLEAVRSKLLLTLALFVVGMLIGSSFIEYLSLGEQEKIFKDLAMGLLSLFVSILAVLLPVEQMQREKERNSLAAILVKPIHRYGFLAGKYLGFCFVLLLVLVTMAALIVLLMLWRGAAWDVNIVKASVLVLCQGWILGACATLLGVVLSSYFLSVLCGISLYLIGNLLEPLREWVEHAQALWTQAGALLLLYLVPHFENLNMQDSVALGDFVPWAYVGENILYTFGYASVVFALGAILFNQKDF